MTRSPLVRLGLYLLALLVLVPAAQAATPPSATEYVTDGWVQDLAVDDDGRRYLVGTFTAVGPRTGNGIALTTTNDQADPSFPDIVGTTVETSVADGSGGWYIGGTFTSVGGVPRRNLAHILADGSVDPAFDPGPDNTVYSIVIDGTSVYVGGNFTSIGGLTRNRVAKVSAAGVVDPAFSANLDGGINTLALAGSRLYLGGSFTTVSGQTRSRIAAVDRTTGAVDAWNPNASGFVNTIAVTGSTVLVGGGFTTIGGQSRNYLAAIDATTGGATNWNPNVSSYVTSMAVSGGDVYVTGGFATVGGNIHSRMAKVDLATGGDDTSWHPAPNAAVNNVQVSGGYLYAAGDFTTIGGETRRRVARLDLSGTGTADPSWNPNLSAGAWTIALDGTDVFVGGKFQSAGANLRPRNGLARLNADGTLDPTWDPSPGSSTSVAAAGDAVFIGGFSGTFNGHARIAKLDAVTGAVDSWDPQITNGAVHELNIADGKVYFAGDFTTVGGVPHNLLARADVTGTGAVDAGWSPPAGAVTGSTVGVASTLITSDWVYYGGIFSVSSPAVPVRLARVSVADGTYDASWAPAIGTASVSPSQVVWALTIADGFLYAGGTFPQPVSNLARVSLATGAVDTGWAPNPNNLVYGLERDRRGAVFAGGLFTTIAGTSQGRLARVLPDGSADATFDPVANGQVTVLKRAGGKLVAGGRFLSVSGSSAPGFAAFTLPSGRLRLQTAGDTGSFAFKLDGAPVTAGTQHTLEAGSYTITETGWTDHTVGYECRANDGAGAVVASGTGAGPATVTIDPGEQVRCVFTNTRPTPPTPEPPVTPQPPVTPPPAPPAGEPIKGGVIGARTGGKVTIRGAGVFREGTVISPTSIIDTTHGFLGIRAGDGRITVSHGVFSLDPASLTLRTRGGTSCAVRRVKVATASDVTVTGRLASTSPTGGYARWITTDRCGGTSIRVFAGTVRVRNLKTGKTVTVKAGQTRLVGR